MSDTIPKDDYRCRKCGAEDEWDEDCQLCIIMKHYTKNKAAYQKMGKMP